MKKLLAISMLLIYLLGITGVVISAHFCCGKIASVQISYAAAQCEHTSKGKKKNCCNDIGHIFKVHDAQQASLQNFSFKTPVLPSPLLPYAMDMNALSKQQTTAVNSSFLHSPPLRTTLPLFIRHSVFRI